MKSELTPEHGPARAVNAVTRRLADVTAAADRIGFRAEIGLREGLEGLVEWWRGQREIEPAS
jgi:UDP-glucose 4-epimerase